MGRVQSFIGSRRDGTIEFALADIKKPTEPFIFFMSQEDAYRLSNKLKNAADKAKRGVEDYDVPGEYVSMQERVGKAYHESREKFTGSYGQKSNTSIKGGKKDE